jgi:pyruvate/2-oxoglutarate/acetoin dehydrogenase E1 component
MRRLSYREAMREALREALAANPRVFLMGEDIGKYGGTYAVTKGLFDEFGPERIRRSRSSASSARASARRSGACAPSSR